MSLEGGLEELPEFFSSRARRASNSAILRSSTAHRGQPVVVACSIIATPSYPNCVQLAKINSKTVNGYTRSKKAMISSIPNESKRLTTKDRQILSSGSGFTPHARFSAV